VNRQVIVRDYIQGISPSLSIYIECDRKVIPLDAIRMPSAKVKLKRRKVKPLMSRAAIFSIFTSPLRVTVYAYSVVEDLKARLI